MNEVRAHEEVRVHEMVLEFPYTRSTGPVIGAFLSGLAEGRLLGSRDDQGRVLVPPLEYDPASGKYLGDSLVDVGPDATVESWTWVAEPLAKHPIRTPFAFAMIRPDGADTAMLHVVEASGPSVMSVGMRVSPKFASEVTGTIRDLTWIPMSDG